MDLTTPSLLLSGQGERREPSGAARWRRLRISRSLVILAHDLSAALASLALAFLLRESGELIRADARFLVHAGPLFLALAGATFLAYGLHRRLWSYTSVGDLGAIVKAATWAVLLFVAVGLWLDRTLAVAPAVSVIQWLVLVVLLCGTRLAYRFARNRARRARAAAAPTPAQDLPVLLYGCGPMAAVFAGAVQSTPGTSLRVVGIIDDTGIPRGRRVHNVPVLGAPAELDRIVADLAVQGIHPQRLVMTRPADELAPAVRSFAERCRARHGLELHFLPDMLGVPAGEGASAELAGSTGERAYFRARRPVELGLAALTLLVLLPLMLLIALTLLVAEGRPILFRQLRPGRAMRPFTLYKFRTMRAPCDARGVLLAEPERIAPLGRLLRRTRLDELPQLLNVLRGEMSFIGPRPLLPRDLPDRITERIALRPGITGWAQVNGGDRLSVEEKIALDAWYVRHAGLLLDLRIVGRTLKMMLLGAAPGRPEPDQAHAHDQGRQRLLVVNRFFHPDPSATSQLLTELADALDARGFAVAVLAGRHSYLNTGAVLPARAWRGGIEVRRLPHTGFGRFSLPGRALDGATFAVSAFLALLLRARPGDLILEDRPAADLGAGVARRAPHRRPAGQLVPGPVPGDRGGARRALGPRRARRRAAGLAQRLAARRRDQRRAVARHGGAPRRAGRAARARHGDPQLGRRRPDPAARA